MATRFINKGPVAEGTGNAHGFSADDNDVIRHHNGTRSGVVSSAKVRTVTGNVTLTAADSGSIVVFDSTTSIVASLPATSAGLVFTFVVKQLTASGGHAVSPVAADKIMGNGFTSADNKDAICSAASDREGDALQVVGDGVDGWYVTSVTGTWAREA